MNICYVLLSPTFGMHQYTADLAGAALQAGHEVHLVTTSACPRDRCSPSVVLHTPVATHDTGLAPVAFAQAVLFSLQPLHPQRGPLHRLYHTIRGLQPDLVHFTGPHLWNVSLLKALAPDGIPTVHTLHDLEPHSSASYGRLLLLWNRQVLRHASHVLVHGARYRELLLRQGAAPGAVTHTPLLHLFVAPGSMPQAERMAAAPTYEPYVLFFGRLERYKGLPVLLESWSQLQRQGGLGAAPRLVLAGAGDLGRLWPRPLPPGVEVRAHLINDGEAVELFSRCALVVLPYLDATQSALVAAACFFRKPVIVTRTGALPEYVEHARTGWVVEPGDAAGLASCLGHALAGLPRLAEMGHAGRTWYDRQRASEREALRSLYARLAPAQLHRELST